MDADNCKARVKFAEDGIVSPWLAIGVPFTKDDKAYYLPNVDEQVAVILDEANKTGIVVCSIFSKVDKPSDNLKGEGIMGIEFDNGDIIKYDKQARQFTLKLDDTTFSIKQTGPALKKTNESLRTILSDILGQLQVETHPVSGANTLVPANAAAYAAIQQRINTFFES